MKLKSTFAYDFHKDKNLQEEILESHKKGCMARHPETKPEGFNFDLVDNLIRIPADKIYLVKKTVQNVCSRIKVDELIDFTFLEDLHDGSRLFVFDADTVVKYRKEGSYISVVGCLNDSKTMKLSHTYFKFFIQDEVQAGDAKILEARDGDDLTMQIRRLFIQVLVFMHLTETQQFVVKPNQSHGVKKEGKYLNNTDFPVTVVDTTWNKIIIRDEEFGVRGHIRICPRNHKEKLVWVRPHVRKGYVRKSKKENEKDN